MKLSEQILSLTQDANIIGEILRDKFFQQDRENGKFGFYSVFKYRPGVIQLSDERNLDYGYEDEGVRVVCAKLDDIVMKGFWEGDGDLSFHFPNGEIVNNSDCKKSNNWHWLSTFEN